MANLPRLKPDPIPPLHPVPEYLADGELKARYEDMKAVLGVPWMGVVTMSFAHYRAFYDARLHRCMSSPQAFGRRKGERAWTTAASDAARANRLCPARVAGD